MKLAILLLWLLFSGSACSPASDWPIVQIPFARGAAQSERFVATILSVYDGDSFSARVELGLGVQMVDKFRLAGVDCPELYTDAGKEVRDAVRARMLNEIVVLTVTRRDKYGRWLASVGIGDEDLATWLVATGRAEPYKGRGPKPFK